MDFVLLVKSAEKMFKRKSYDKVGRETRRKLYRKKLIAKKMEYMKYIIKKIINHILEKRMLTRFRKKAHIKKLNSDALTQIKNYRKTGMNLGKKALIFL